MSRHHFAAASEVPPVWAVQQLWEVRQVLVVRSTGLSPLRRKHHWSELARRVQSGKEPGTPEVLKGKTWLRALYDNVRAADFPDTADAVKDGTAGYGSVVESRIELALAIDGLLVLLLLALIEMHVGAALFHYFIRKDNVLGRMLPGLLRR